jgi:hypothetical protein
MKNDRDVIDAMADAMRSMGLYIVLVFFAAQFVAFFGTPGSGRSSRCSAPTLVALNLDNPARLRPVHPDVLLRQPDARLGERPVGGDGARSSSPCS